MPVLVICPKNPDSLKYNLILRDISPRLPHMDRVTIGRLISFAIAGAGFSNVGQFMRRRIIQNISDQQVNNENKNILFLCFSKLKKSINLIDSTSLFIISPLAWLSQPQ